jgi:hypothetical protein
VGLEVAGGDFLLATDGKAILSAAGTTYMQPASGNTNLVIQAKPLGTATLASVQLNGQVSASVGTRADFEQSGANTTIRNQTLGGGSQGYITFDHDGTPRMRIATTGNLLIGTTSDLGYGLHAANKGTNGNFLCFDPTATTGVTTCAFQAGAGQSSLPLMSWRNNAGADVGKVGATGNVFSPRFEALAGDVFALQTNYSSVNALLLRSARGIGWSSDATWYGTIDASFSRSAANTLQVGDGGANANGTLLLTAVQWQTGTRPTCNSGNRFKVWAVAGGAGVLDTFEVCRKDAADAYAWVSLF